MRIKPKHFAGQGDKVFRHNPNLDASQAQAGTAVINKEKYATLGCFAKSSDDIKVALTTSHFVNTAQSVYVNDESRDVQELGECIQSIDTNEERYIEIAVVKVLNSFNEAATLSQLKLCDEKDIPKSSKAANLDNLKCPITVFKKGARTGWTEGSINKVRDGYWKNLVLVESVYDNEFAKEGDSGSIVFRHHGDPEDQILDALAMVLGAEKPEILTEESSTERKRTLSSSSAASESSQSSDEEDLEDLRECIWCSDLAQSLYLLETKSNHRMKITLFSDFSDSD